MFEFDVGVPAEPIERYCPGGYHPVYIDDRLDDGRYQIVQKLGWGSFSTVWLARDLVEERNVSIKVVVAEKPEKICHELQILKHLATSRSDSPGRKYVLHLLDSFYVTGPNGQHLCIVLDVLGPGCSRVAERSRNNRLSGAQARKVSKQLLMAVNFLHESGVAHGDIHTIHTGNILFRVLELDNLDPSAIAQRFGLPLIGYVTRKDGAALGPGVPKYLVEPFEHYDIPELGDIQLIDFGESFFIDNPPQKLYTPLSFHPPELVFQHALDKAVDIWNLGCTIYDLVIGRTLFEVSFENRELVPEFNAIIGNMPPHWVPDALKTGVLVEHPKDGGELGYLPLEEMVHLFYFGTKGGYIDPETLDLSVADTEMLSRCLRRMLVLDPELRAKAMELVDDPWFTV
ncbi:kinase-like domain-containing protein [Trichophaea hybrida]|nr:kinase-like domain-containing protein [Trichophaea hybrida]